jgi:hypothetical protein
MVHNHWHHVPERLSLLLFSPSNYVFLCQQSEKRCTCDPEMRVCCFLSSTKKIVCGSTVSQHIVLGKHLFRTPEDRWSTNDGTFIRNISRNTSATPTSCPTADRLEILFSHTNSYKPSSRLTCRVQKKRTTSCYKIPFTSISRLCGMKNVYTLQLLTSVFHAAY